MGSAYSKQLNAVEGEGTLSWWIESYDLQLPSGLVLDSDGLIHGTPDAGTDGVYNLRFNVKDECYPVQGADAKLKLIVNPANSPDGWALGVGATTSNYGSSVAADSSGSEYVAGSFSGTIKFPGNNPDPIVSNGKKTVS